MALPGLVACCGVILRFRGGRCGVDKYSTLWRSVVFSLLLFQLRVG